MGKKTKFLILGVLALMIAAPLFALSAGLVPCGDKGEPPCTLCSLFDLAQSIINWLTTIVAPAIAVLAFTVGGFKILMSGPNPGLRAEGIKAIRNGAIGLLIVFGSWIIVNEFLLFFVGSQNITKTSTGTLMPWTEITCIPPVKVPEAPAPTNLVAIPKPINVKATACTGGASACKVDAILANRLSILANNYPPSQWQVTEAYPPTVTHKDPCHQNGTCVDINFFTEGIASITAINSFISAASKAGLRAVYEVSNTTDRATLLDVAKMNNISLPPGSIIVASITAPHFSVYNN